MRNPLIRVASLAVAAALMTPLATSQATPSAPAASDRRDVQGAHYTPPAPEWGPCENPRLQSIEAECGMLVVPLDWSKPQGRKIKIAVSRKLATDPDRKGMLAANPGGPGGSGLIYPLLAGSIPNGVGHKYDWYGFDPRGVGSSEPALSCNPNYRGAGYDRPNYVPKRKADERWWKQTTRRYARACGRSDAKRLLPHMKTVDVAKDLDALRRAVGEKKLNYLGFSYGTYLGQVYATLFPKRVGRFIWDGVVDADKAFYESNLGQNVAFDKNMNVYWRYLAKRDDHFGLGTDWRAIRKGYYRQLRKLDRNPQADGKLGPDELNDAMLTAGYYVYYWVEIGEAYAALVNRGDGGPILDWYGGPGDDNSFAVYLGVQCTDAKWPGWKKTRADAVRLHKKHPFLTWNNTWYNRPCIDWPAASRKAIDVKGKKVQSRILLISETRDAATPYAGALATRRTFPTSFLIEGVGGTTHSGSLSGIGCVDNTIATYLDTGKLPRRKPGANRSDKKCDPVPAPEPTAPEGFRGAPVDRMPAAIREALRQAQMTGR